MKANSLDIQILIILTGFAQVFFDSIVLADYPIDNEQAFLFWCWQIEKIPLTDEQRRRIKGQPEFERANMSPSEADVRVLLEMAKAAGPMMDEEIRAWFEGLEGGQTRTA